MSYICCKKIQGKKYFYEVESIRKDGKVKQRIINYWGTIDPRKNPSIIPKPFSSAKIIDIVDAKSLIFYKIVNELKFTDYVDDLIYKRQGSPIGTSLFLMIIHKLCGVNPSLNNIGQWIKTTPLKKIKKLNIEQLTTNNLSRVFDKIMFRKDEFDFSYGISKALFNAAKKRYNLKIENIFYDVTSTYFEGNKCPIALYGYNRDQKIDKLQINIGLVVCDDGGFPIVSRTFPGNISDVKTVHDIIYYMKIIQGIKEATAIMDRGMGSENNLKMLEISDYEHVIGLTSKLKIVNKLREKYSDKIIMKKHECTATKNGNKIFVLKISKILFKKRRNIVIVFNPEQAQEQIENMNRIIRGIEQRLEECNDRSATKMKEIESYSSNYFKYNEKTGNLERNEEKILKTKKRAGKSVLLTSIDKDSATTTYKKYFSKDMIEKAFQFEKQNYLRPIFRRLENRVKADVFLSHIGYFFMCCLKRSLKEKGIDLTYEQLERELNDIKIIVRKTETDRTFVEIFTRDDTQKKIVDVLKLRKDVVLLYN